MRAPAVEVGTHCPEKRWDFRDRLSMVRGCPRFSHGVGLIEAEVVRVGSDGRESGCTV